LQSLEELPKSEGLRAAKEAPAPDSTDQPTN
jgi:hypothetical protein